jgi:hypothetical protein
MKSGTWVRMFGNRDHQPLTHEGVTCMVSRLSVWGPLISDMRSRRYTDAVLALGPSIICAVIWIALLSTRNGARVQLRPPVHGFVMLTDFDAPKCPYPWYLVSTNALTRHLVPALSRDKSVRTNANISEWVYQACPGVAAHFLTFPYFLYFVHDLPMMTTAYAAQSVCIMLVASEIARSAGTHLRLHAGSHWGALRHGGPIPWDDDTDMAMDYDNLDAFMESCRIGNYTAGLGVKCVKSWNAVKLFVRSTGSDDVAAKSWRAPFLDIWLLSQNTSKMCEVTPQGKPMNRCFWNSNYFPVRPYYFGGAVFSGPNPMVATERYVPDMCIASLYNHRIEATIAFRGSTHIDCCEMSTALPFVYNGSVLFNGHTAAKLPITLTL